jgi:hypothetical protein
LIRRSLDAHVSSVVKVKLSGIPADAPRWKMSWNTISGIEARISQISRMEITLSVLSVPSVVVFRVSYGGSGWRWRHPCAKISSKPAASVVDQLLTNVEGKASLLFYGFRLQRICTARFE